MLQATIVIVCEIINIYGLVRFGTMLDLFMKYLALSSIASFDDQFAGHLKSSKFAVYLGKVLPF